MAYNSQYTGAEHDAYVSKTALVDLIYPVGSIYMSVNTVSPATLFGGTWEAIQDKFLLCSGNTYVSGSTGGRIEHSHLYGIKFGAYYRSIALEQNTAAGLLQYGDPTKPVNSSVNAGTAETTINNAVTTASKTASMSHYAITTDTSIENNMPPYLTVNMWKRTA